MLHLSSKQITQASKRSFTKSRVFFHCSKKQHFLMTLAEKAKKNKTAVAHYVHLLKTNMLKEKVSLLLSRLESKTLCKLFLTRISCR